MLDKIDTNSSYHIFMDLFSRQKLFIKINSNKL